VSQFTVGDWTVGTLTETPRHTAVRRRTPSQCRRYTPWPHAAIQFSISVFWMSVSHRPITKRRRRPNQAVSKPGEKVFCTIDRRSLAHSSRSEQCRRDSGAVPHTDAALPSFLLIMSTLLEDRLCWICGFTVSPKLIDLVDARYARMQKCRASLHNSPSISSSFFWGSKRISLAGYIRPPLDFLTDTDWHSDRHLSHTGLATNLGPSIRFPFEHHSSPCVHDDPGWVVHLAPGPSVVNHSRHPVARDCCCFVAGSPAAEDSHHLGQSAAADIRCSNCSGSCRRIGSWGLLSKAGYRRDHRLRCILGCTSVAVRKTAADRVSPCSR